MAEQSFMEKIGATPSKAAVAAVLAGVFVSLLIVQLSDESSVSAAVPSRNGPATTAIISRGKTISAKPEGTVPPAAKARPWPEVTLEEVRKHNPFFMPAAFGESRQKSRQSDADALKQKDLQQRAEARRQALTSLRDKGVGVVLRSGDELVAMIGSTTVRVGDVIDGFKVVGIGPDGVMLEPDELK